MSQEPAHHTILRTCASLHCKDRVTEWWTVTNQNRFYDVRYTIPFNTMFCHDGPGGIVVYLDMPEPPHTITPVRAEEIAAYEAEMLQEVNGLSTHDLALELQGQLRMILTRMGDDYRNILTMDERKRTRLLTNREIYEGNVRMVCKNTLAFAGKDEPTI